MKYTRREIFSIPNVMGYARILLIPAFMITYIRADSSVSYILPSLLLLCSALLDLFDGMIARRFHMVTDLGKMLDPVADKLTHGAVAICLALRYPLMIPLLILMLVKELYMAIKGYLHLRRGGAVYGAMRFGKICTATLFIAFTILAVFPYLPLLYVNLLIVICMCVMLITLLLYVRHFGKEKPQKHVPFRIAKKIVCLCLLLFGIELLYLAIGALSPFAHYRSITKETVASFDAEHAFDACATGERVRLIEDNSDALRERIRLFLEAEEQIVISTFDVREGSAFRDMAAALLARADQGVSVKILLDGFNLELHMKDSALLSALNAHPNIDVRAYNELSVLTPWTSQGRMHDKYVIIDDFAYLIGGRNTFDYFLTDHADGSYDRELLVYETVPRENHSCKELLSYFESVWNCDVTVPLDSSASSEHSSVLASLHERYGKMKQHEYADCFEPCDWVARTYETDGIILLSNPTHIYGKEPVLFYKLTEMMAEAKKCVRIHTPYAALNGYMLERLQMVSKHVPSVSMMLNGIENGDNVVASSDYLYNKDMVLDTGVRLLEYQGGTSYHAKTVLIDDDISIVGSFNFDLRSAYMDTELMLAVKCEALNRELSDLFDSYEASACEQTADGGSIIPPGVTVNELSLGEKILYQTIGLFLQPFRYLV